MRHYLTNSVWLATGDDDSTVRLLEHNGKAIQALPLPDHALQLAQEVLRLAEVLEFAVKLEALNGGGGLETDLGTVWRNRTSSGYRIDLDAEEDSVHVLYAADAARLAFGLRAPLQDKVNETLETL